MPLFLCLGLTMPSSLRFGLDNVVVFVLGLANVVVFGLDNVVVFALWA